MLFDRNRNYYISTLRNNLRYVNKSEAYIKISNNTELLKQLRENLREMLKRSPLMNYNSYANQFAEMLRRWWAKRCNEEKLK